MISTRRIRAALFLAVGLLFCATEALALPKAARGKDKEVQTLLAEARTATKEERFADAVAALRRAQSVAPGVEVDVALARALDQLGKHVEASDLLRRVAEAPAKTPKEKAAVQAGKKLLVDVDKRTPRIEVVLVGGAGKATVTLDGQPIQPGELSHDPGQVLVAANAPGHYRAAKKLKLVAGSRERVELRLKPVKK